MEANYERREEEEVGEQGKKNDPMWKAKEVIRASIITTPKDGAVEVEREGTNTTGGEDVAKKLDDILVFSRSIHNIDSSLE